MQKLPVSFAVFHDVPDVTGPDTEALCRGDGVLRRNVGIRYRKQKITDGVYGKSITDACLGWEKTERLVLELADLL